MGEQNSLSLVHLSHFSSWTFAGENRGHPGISAKWIKYYSENLGLESDVLVTGVSFKVVCMLHTILLVLYTSVANATVGLYFNDFSFN